MNRTARKFGFGGLSGALLVTGLLVLPSLGSAHQPDDLDNVPDGITRAMITEDGSIDAMSVLIIDAPKPALMLSYKGDSTLTVFDTENKPFLRFEANRVEANSGSALAAQLPQARSFGSGEDDSWVKVSGSGSFGWVDARLSPDVDIHEGESAQWVIPVRHGQSDKSAISGQLVWNPIQSGAGNNNH